MAKIQLSAIANKITGRVGDFVYYVRNGVQCVRSIAVNPSNPQTARQQLIRGIISDLSSSWVSLNETQQRLWGEFASMTKDLRSGQGAFHRHNYRLRMSDHQALGCIYSPPTVPATPEFPLGFCVTPIDGTHFCFTWTSPINVCLFITGNYKLPSGICCQFPTYGDCPDPGYSPGDRFIKTERSDQGYLVMTHTWPSGLALKFKVKSIDHWGRISPWSHWLSAAVP